jgi:hypothetical protein
MVQSVLYRCSSNGTILSRASSFDGSLGTQRQSPNSLPSRPREGGDNGRMTGNNGATEGQQQQQSGGTTGRLTIVLCGRDPSAAPSG